MQRSDITASPRENPLTGTVTPVKETPYSNGEWKVVECQETGMVFLENPPDYSRLVEEFAWEKTFEEESKRRRQEEPVVAFASSLSKSLKRRLRKRERLEKVSFSLLDKIARERPAETDLAVVDVGCGSGEKLLRIVRQYEAVRDTSLRPIGIEISAQLAQETDQCLGPIGGRCIHSSAIDGLASLEDASVDLVILCSYLEHEIRPLEVLQNVSLKLRKGGYVIVKVPNYGSWNRRFRQRRWCGFRYPDHVNYFTPQTLIRIIESSGLKVRRMNLRDCLPTNDNVWAIARR
tara:strand:- start:95 stop:967 length:873 start_codon:yes stop_codon:yes gene_type:complete